MVLRESANGDGNGNGKTGAPAILVVDDDAEIRESLKDALEDAGYAVTTACYGRDGLDKLDAMTRPGLSLLDLMMPVMSGPEFLDELHEGSHADVPVVVVSAYGHMADSTTGIAEFVRKPVRLDTLLESVRRCCS